MAPKFSKWCRCCGNTKDQHPVIVGFASLCAIFMAYDLEEHQKNYGHLPIGEG